VAYDDAPTVGNYHGQTGVWINTTTIADDAISDYYSAVQDAYTGGQLGTATYSHNFYSTGTLQSYWNSYQDIPSWTDYGKALLSTVGGLAEMGIGAVTTEFGIGGYLLVDGASRAMFGGAKIYMLATEGKKAAEGVPENMGGAIGVGADYIFGTGNLFQSSLSTANSFTTLFFSGGTYGIAEDLSEGIESANLIQRAMNIVSGLNDLNELNEFTNHAINP
jgi:hypothetical protein